MLFLTLPLNALSNVVFDNAEYDASFATIESSFWDIY